MQRKKHFKKWILVMLVVGALALTTACDEDYNLEGTGIISDESLISDPDASATVIAYSQQLKGVQTNIPQLGSGMLGIYQDPTFGKTTVNLLSQVRLSRTNPQFGAGARADSVKLYMPYYSRSIIETDTTFILDSIYADKPMKIELFESKYFLRQVDPESNFEDFQPYYSDQSSLFESYLGTKLGEVEEFQISLLPILHATGEGDEKKVDRLEPGFYMDLPTEFFEDKVLNMEGKPELVSNESFIDHFRGIYFKVSDINDLGSMFLFQTENAWIRIYYSSNPSEDGEERPTGTIDLNFAESTKVETFEKEYSSYVQQQLSVQDTLQGSSRLLLQGGESIVSVINLFGEDSNDSGVADELEQLRLDRPIVNEANLKLYVDQEALNDNYIEPERIIIFNAKSGNVLTDYTIDQTASASTLDSKIVHLGRLHRDENGKGEYYKIRITNYISNLINNVESINFPLGIAVIPNVEVAAAAKVRKEENAPVMGVPTGTIFSPRGTVIHGPNSENEEKRLKLELYLTHYTD